VGFCKVVGKVTLARRLPLLGAVTNPVETHVHGLGLADFCCFVGGTDGCGVVSYETGSMLGVTQVI
jgi:hypothetical protein